MTDLDLTPNFRALCAQLTKRLALSENPPWELIDRALAALATPPPTDDDLIEIARELRKTAEYLQLGCGWNKALRAIESAANLIEGDLLQRLVPPPEPPTVMEIIELSTEIEEAGLGQIDLVRAALERWGR